MLRFDLRFVLLVGLTVGSVAIGWGEMGAGSASGGGISNNGHGSDLPSLAISPDGTPVVAWTDYSNCHDSYSCSEIYVRRWNGTAWVEMGAGSASGGGISDTNYSSWSPSVASGPDSAPVVAWQDNYSIYVRRWNGSAWAEMGAGSATGNGISGNSGFSFSPSLAIGPDNAPIIAWVGGVEGSHEVYVRRWNGTTWVEMGAGSASGGGISNTGRCCFNGPSVAVHPDGAPIIAWDDSSTGDYEIYVRRWNGSAWVEMGAGSASGEGISTQGSFSTSPAVAVGPDGMPIVAWKDRTNDSHDDILYREIYVRRWNGSAWVEMGAGSASGNGISNNSGDSGAPSLAIGLDNAPVVAWEDDSSNYYEIYVRRWNGSAWIEMGTGSATGGGISANNYLSRYPSLAIRSDGTPIVAWSDLRGGDWEIYVRHYLPKIAYVPLTVVLSCWPGPGEGEPNNNTSQAAGPLCPGRTYTGLPNDRYDVFYLDAASGPLAINLTNHLSSGVQLQLHHQAITPHPIVLDHNGADGYRIELPNAAAGRYYIVIATATPSSSTTRYTLMATFTTN